MGPVKTLHCHPAKEQRPWKKSRIFLLTPPSYVLHIMSTWQFTQQLMHFTAFCPALKEETLPETRPAAPYQKKSNLLR